MKTIVLAALLSVGCKDAVKQDLEMFCATDVTGKTPSVWGPGVEAAAKSADFKKPLELLKAGSLDLPAFTTYIARMNQQAGITKCPALETIAKP